MKHKEFAIWPFLGLDMTPRKCYRYRLSLNKSVIDEQRKEIDRLMGVGQLKEEQLEQLRSEWSDTESANSKLIAENVTLKSEVKRFEAETKRQYKAYKALADRQEETEKELIDALEAKKQTEIENSMLQEQVARLERKLAKFDRPRGKKGRFHKPAPAPNLELIEEVVEEAVVEAVEAEIEQITEEVIATAEAVTAEE